MNATDRAYNIKSKLQSLETAVDALVASPSATTANTVQNRTSVLHNALQHGLDEQATTLGISSTDLGSITSGGGTNKTYGAEP